MPIKIYECNKGHREDYLLASDQEPNSCAVEGCRSKSLTRVYEGQTFSPQTNTKRSEGNTGITKVVSAYLLIPIVRKESSE